MEESESILTSVLKAVEVGKDAFKEVPRLSVDKVSKITSPPPGYGSVFFMTENPIKEIVYKDAEEEEE